MDINRIKKTAELMASQAKPGYMSIEGILYTFEFCQHEWVYKVYKEGSLYKQFNTKSLSKAKQMLLDYLNN